MTFSRNAVASFITVINTGEFSSALNSKTFFTPTNIFTASLRSSEQNFESFSSTHAFSKNFNVNFSKIFKPEFTKSKLVVGVGDGLKIIKENVLFYT